MTDSPLIEGVLGGFAGIITGMVIDAMLPVFSALDLPVVFWFVLAIVLLADLFSGLAEAYAGGFLFAIGLLCVGFLMTDLTTIMMGLVGIIGFVIGAAAKSHR